MRKRRTRQEWQALLDLNEFGITERMSPPPDLIKQFFLGRKKGAGEPMACLLLVEITPDIEEHVPEFVGEGKPLALD